MIDRIIGAVLGTIALGLMLLTFAKALEFVLTGRYTLASGDGSRWVVLVVLDFVFLGIVAAWFSEQEPQDK